MAGYGDKIVLARKDGIDYYGELIAEWIVFVERLPDGTWGDEQIYDPAPFEPPAYDELQMLLDSQGNTHWFWRTESYAGPGRYNAILWHVVRYPDGTSSEVSKVFYDPDESRSLGRVKVTLSADGIAMVVAYWTVPLTDAAIWSSTYQGGEWSTPIEVARGVSAALAADLAGNIHLIFSRVVAEPVRHATWSNSEGWMIDSDLAEDKPQRVYSGNPGPMAVDNDGTVYYLGLEGDTLHDEENSYPVLLRRPPSGPWQRVSQLPLVVRHEGLGPRGFLSGPQAGTVDLIWVPRYDPGLAGFRYPTGSANWPNYPTSPDINGDVNGDGEVDILDLAAVAAAFNTTSGAPAYGPAADLNGDDIVDIFDLVLVGLNFGATVSS